MISSPPKPPPKPRQLAFLALQKIYQKGAYTDMALEAILSRAKLNNLDRNLVCELVYGIVRRQRTLDSLINLLGKKKAHQQNPKLRIILHIGLYQLRYLNQIPQSAAVNTTVELAKENNLKGLSGVVNGVLRQYIRNAVNQDPLVLPEDNISQLGIKHSLPDWIVEIFLKQFSLEDTDRLFSYFNKAPNLDLRINILKISLQEAEKAFTQAGIQVEKIPYLPQALRLTSKTGSIEKLPGFKEGWWIIQDSSAQLVIHFLDPQPSEVIIDACAAPGGKTTHIAELMGDTGQIIACDYLEKRLKKVTENALRLNLKSIATHVGDSRKMPQYTQKADKVLVDAPCSGFGTLHKRPDIRWKQTPEKILQLAQLQKELLQSTATWVKSGGRLVYSTCTLNPTENEEVIQSFLDSHPHWQIETPSPNSPPAFFVNREGMIKVLPHQHQMDGFFMVKLKKD